MEEKEEKQNIIMNEIKDVKNTEESLLIDNPEIKEKNKGLIRYFTEKRTKNDVQETESNKANFIEKMKYNYLSCCAKNNKNEEIQRILENETEETDQSNTKGITNVKEKIKGIFLSLTLVILVGTSSVCVPLLERKIPDFELNSFRSGFSWVIISIALLFTKELPKVPRSEIGSLLLFSVTTVFTSLTMYVSVSLIPMSYYKSLFFRFLIINGLFLFPKFLGEKMKIESVFFAILCAFGVILSIQPPFIFTWKEQYASNSDENRPFKNVTLQNGTLKQTNTLENSRTIATIVGCALSILCGIGETVQIIILKINPYLQENILQNVFWNSAFSTIAGLLIMAFFEHPVLPRGTKQIGLILAHSLSCVLGWCCTILATRYISGNTMNIIYSTLVVLMLIPQYTLLSHILPGNHNWIEVLGTFLVLIGAVAGSVLDIWRGN